MTIDWTPRERLHRSAGWSARRAANASGPVRHSERSRTFASCEHSPSIEFPFLLGVASGDARQDAVVIWTRLASAPDEPDGGLPQVAIPVFWQVASDDEFRCVEQFGTVLAQPDNGHSVRIDVRGLAPAGVYWYRFHAAGHASAVGSARTLPAPNSRIRALRFAVLCSDACAAQAHTLRELARDDLDFVLSLERTLTPGGNDERDLFRLSREPPQRALAELRQRHARQRTNPHFLAARAAFSFHAHHHDAAQDAREGPLAALRALERRVHWEHTPVRSAWPSASALADRALTLGSLAELKLGEPAQRTAITRPDETAARRRAPSWQVQIARSDANETFELSAQHGSYANTRVRCRKHWWHGERESEVDLDEARLHLTTREPGYLRCDIHAESVRSDLMVLSDSAQPAPTLEERASYTFELPEP